MAPRLIRRRPLSERIKSCLDPVDFLLWLSEQVDSTEWDSWQQQWALPTGLALNLVFLVARANTGHATSSSGDEVFGDEDDTARWSSWFSTFVVHALVVLVIANAIRTFWRRRHYRLFEKPVSTVPSTPSARRVRVNSSPVSSSPLRFLSSVLAGESAESRGHPDSQRDVWEISVWDPTPFSLNLFCLLSPGHALIYLAFLPTARADPRPSTSVATVLLLNILLSIQLFLLRSNFSQQSKDASLIHKEVMNEYDTKYVHPSTTHLMRDVGTQFSSRRSRKSGSPSIEIIDDDVDTYAPAYIINKGFHTRPNPAYAQHVSSDTTAQSRTAGRADAPAALFQTPLHRRDAYSPTSASIGVQQPSFRTNTVSDGGSLGVYSHANSPLRRSTSNGMNSISSQLERAQSPQKLRGSPLKRHVNSITPDGFRPR